MPVTLLYNKYCFGDNILRGKDTFFGVDFIDADGFTK